MAKPPPSRPRKDQLADTVDRLLAKLPGADPTLTGDPEPRSGPTRPGAVSGVPPRRTPGWVPSGGPTARDRGLAWLIAMSGLVLGAAMSQWPYAHGCGLGLFAYLTAIVALLLVGAWAAMAAWRCRMPAVHVVALIVIFWSIVLAAEQILPRVGYAYETATWMCR